MPAVKSIKTFESLQVSCYSSSGVEVAVLAASQGSGLKILRQKIDLWTADIDGSHPCRKCSGSFRT